MFIPHLFAIAVSVASTSAVYQGFNYGSTFTDSSPVLQSDFQNAIHHSTEALWEPLDSPALVFLP